ncbi:hypothetical protein [Geomicrobium sp. JCM 19055]|uniref:hypothetical protein n=1 Tax=Geomicrobium sp. JCM 19055 TaxID=1460649 RepID=UPI00187C3711|nr:hypothetical protein [Geomicrobium sp. JCM 19055]
MRVYRWRSSIVAMLFVLLLTACNDNSEGTEEAEESVENEEAQEVDGGEQPRRMYRRSI